MKHLFIWLIMFQYVTDSTWSVMPGHAYKTEVSCKAALAIWEINAKKSKYAPKAKCEFYPDQPWSAA